MTAFRWSTTQNDNSNADALEHRSKWLSHPAFGGGQPQGSAPAKRRLHGGRWFYNVPEKKTNPAYRPHPLDIDAERVDADGIPD